MTFEDLDAWKKARDLVNRVYAVTRQNALAKDFGLCGQIQRAAVSVMSNLAEGFERQHAGEKFQAYNVARASCGEVRSLLARKLGGTAVLLTILSSAFYFLA